MNPIFISYRRDDNISAVKLLKAILESELGKDTVFLDTTTMGPGEKWRQSLKDAVTNARVVIALIGPYWKGAKYWKTNNKEDNRLFNDDDWVRLELETALQDKSKKIIPMIFYPDKIEGFNDTIPFIKGTLPPSLVSLSADNNKAIIHEKQFEDDLKRTIIEISPFVQSEDVLADLPLPDYNPQNPLDHFPEHPFKGLNYFTEQDARIFFGRGEQIIELFYKLSGNPLVLFYGQSGVGKSSLLFAGLKRRIEKKGWIVEYWRRETTINLAEKINTYRDNTSNERSPIVILDQIEEIYTNPSKILSLENEKFQLIESIENALRRKIHILLGFREEYLARIQELLDAKSIMYGKMPLRHMQVKGVLEAIEGITKSPQTKYIYNLSFENNKDVPQKIAYLVLNDKESFVAPLIQLLLRKLWDRVYTNYEERIITEKLFDEIKSQSLRNLLSDQIELLRPEFSNEIDRGLVLDLLYFFTTALSTSASHTNEELKRYYDYEGILDLTDALKNKYLLTSLQSENLHITRLAHDALAPLIRELYGQSMLPAQHASRLLESKKQDIEAGAEVDFSKTDLAIIDAGKFGMRKLTETELKVIEQSRMKIREHDLELEAALKEAQEQTLQAKAKALAATARQVLQTDPTVALRLAEAACKITTVVTREAQSAIVDILRQKSVFYKENFDGHTDSVASVAFSPNSKFVLTGSWDTTAKLWNLDGTLKQSFEGESTDVVSSVAFSPNGKLILVGSAVKTAKLWNLNGTLKQTFQVDAVNSVAFSPDGKFILIASKDKTPRLWNLDGTLKHSFEDHTDDVYSVAFSPDGKFILSGSHDKTAKLWNLDGTLKHTFEAGNSVYSVAFSPDGKLILVGVDKTAKLWNLDGTFKGSLLEPVHTDFVNSVAFSPDGKFILTGSADKTAKLWSLYGTLEQSFEDGIAKIITSVAFSPDGKFILTGSQDQTAKLWNLNVTPKQTFEGNNDFVFSVAFSRDGKFMLTASQHRAMVWNLDGTLKQKFESENTDIITSVAFSPDGKFILTGGSKDQTAKLWNLDGTLKQTFEGHTDIVSSVAFSPDGKFILTGSQDQTAKLWNLNGTLKQTFEGHPHLVSLVVFSPDGKLIVTGCKNQTANLWNLNGTLKQTFKGQIISVAFSHVGKFIFTLGSDFTSVELWNFDGTLKQSFEGHTDVVSTVTFSPGGNFILTGSADNTARLWNLDGTLKQTFEGHKLEISSVAFSPDCKFILTGSADSTAKLWRPFWEILNPENTYVLSADQMKEYDIPEDIEWGKIW